MPEQGESGRSQQGRSPQPGDAPAPGAPGSIHEVNHLPVDWKAALYRLLIPSQVLVEFGIHPIRLTDRQGREAVTCHCPDDTGSLQIEVRHQPDAEDPLLLLHLQDTSLGGVVVAFMSTNDPRGERFAIDRDEQGRDTLLGTARRNVPAEVSAMQHGLAPGQVRRGLRLLDEVMARLEAFLVMLGETRVIVEPLAYHNAILLERHGFTYAQGQLDMERIHEGFQTGGWLADQLDGSTPFRKPEAARTIRGRSWAIHDGILEKRWEGVKMVKRLGPPSQVDTAPDVPW